MPAGYQDLFIEQGADFYTELTLNDDYGAPYNLTNFTVRSQARKSYYAANATINFSADITEPANGKIALLAASNVTSNLVSSQRLVYDVVIKDEYNTVTRVLEGTIFISPSVTRYA